MLYVFSVTITDPDYSAQDYAQAWLRASHYIQSRPGARGTRLHRSVNDPHRLLAIASWASKADRDAMDVDPPAEIAQIIADQTPHVEIQFLGEYDDADWEVLPPSIA